MEVANKEEEQEKERKKERNITTIVRVQSKENNNQKKQNQMTVYCKNTNRHVEDKNLGRQIFFQLSLKTRF